VGSEPPRESVGTPPEPTGPTVYTGVTLPVSLWRRLSDTAAKQHLARNVIVAEALVAYLDQFDNTDQDPRSALPSNPTDHYDPPGQDSGRQPPERNQPGTC
jgi:hypothetical protein